MSTSIYQGRTLLVTLCGQTCDRCGRRRECLELCTDARGVWSPNVAHLCMQCWAALFVATFGREDLEAPT